MNFLRLLLYAPSNLEFLLHDACLGLRSQFLDFLLMRSCVVMLFFVVLMMMLVTFDRLERFFQESGQEIGVGNFVAAEKLLVLQMSILRGLRSLLMHWFINWLEATVALPQVRRKWFLHIIPVSKDLVLQLIDVLLIVMSLDVVRPLLVLSEKKGNNQLPYRFLDKTKRSIQCVNVWLASFLMQSLERVQKQIQIEFESRIQSSSKLELETLINKMFIDQSNLK